MKSPLILLFAIIPLARCLAATDSPSDADPAQSGYLPNHNMDPTVVGSPAFKIKWQKSFEDNEVFYAKPLVYTPASTGTQIVFTVSSRNWIRTFDAKTGNPIAERQPQAEFDTSILSCPDMLGYLGVTGTPVIDPNTNTAYFFVRTNISNYRVPDTDPNAGFLNGVYYFYAVNIVTLDDVPGYPFLIDGSTAENDAARYFHGGLTIQRTALTLIDGVVYGGFSGQCDNWNYTGMMIGVSTGLPKLVAAYAMEAGPGTRHDPWNTQGQGAGGGAGIWMSGMAPATLNDGRIFFVTGNGYGRFNQNNPAKGNSGLATLDECVVNMAISPTGDLSLGDYFEPSDYINLDESDSDFGSGGIVLLDKNTFNGEGVSQIGVAVGKPGTIYILNADDLGGYKEGSNEGDLVLQTIQLPTLPAKTGVYGGCGSYPLEGGYLYCSPICRPSCSPAPNTYAYKFSKDGSGTPVFTQVGLTTETNAYGAGPITVTSNNGKPGSGIVWSTDPNDGLRAWSAIPSSDGTLQLLTAPGLTPGIFRFQRPVFGDGMAYVVGLDGTLYCVGN